VHPIECLDLLPGAYVNVSQDVSNFDTVFTGEEALDSVVEDSHLSQTVQAQFAGEKACLFPPSSMI
jgi:hypothetical protein